MIFTFISSIMLHVLAAAAWVVTAIFLGVFLAAALAGGALDVRVRRPVLVAAKR